jgi:pyrroline-5-carboxylate reductase
MLLIASEAIACMSAANGMPWSDSYGLTAAVMSETATLMSEKGVHPAQIKDMLCQPESLAIDALQALEQIRLRTAMINACNEACNQIGKNRMNREEPS